MNDDTLYTLEEAEKIFLRRLAKLAEKRSVQFREAISAAGMGMMLSDGVWDKELADTFGHLADEQPAVTNNTYNVQRDLIYQPEQMVYPDNQLSIDFAKYNS